MQRVMQAERSGRRLSARGGVVAVGHRWYEGNKMAAQNGSAFVIALAIEIAIEIVTGSAVAFAIAFVTTGRIDSRFDRRERPEIVGDRNGVYK